MTNIRREPIFVHASPRSGSTYFFNVLRRDKTLMCFNEAIIDVFSYYGKWNISRFKAAHKWNVNHRFLDRDDFDEFVVAWDDVMRLYPQFPSFQDYLPANGTLAPSLFRYMSGLIEYAWSRDKRPALCEIHSRGRAGALRAAFGGFHIAQYRDPLSQFGSFVRPLLEAGEWGFLTFPLMELGISGAAPLYQLVPERWRVPVLPWPADDRSQRWATAVQYMATVASDEDKSIERLLRWHLFSWTLSNLAAVSHADLTLDIDKAHDDPAYRKTVIDALAGCRIAADFRDITKFSRYYEFEGLDIKRVCEEVETAMWDTLHSGALDAALRSLGKQEPTISAAAATELLLMKFDEAVDAMAVSGDRRRISMAEWRAICGKHRAIWFKPALRRAAQRVYPVAAPLAQAARRIGIWH